MSDVPGGQPPASTASDASAPRWQPLSATDRRVLGVLVEKAKTTPEAYPMTLNSITTACNQKTNRAPLMQLEPEQVGESLERLRKLGAITLIEGAGRVEKYRHYLYDWLNVDKAEAAVIAELLLRGDQTEGDLRSRAARMEPIRDLNELRPVLESLRAKNLIISLTPEGRGHVVSHNLYKPNELERLKAQYATSRSGIALAEPEPSVAPVAPPPMAASGGLQREVQELQAQVAQLRSDLADLASAYQDLSSQFERLKAELGG